VRAVSTFGGFVTGIQVGAPFRSIFSGGFSLSLDAMQERAAAMPEALRDAFPILTTHTMSSGTGSLGSVPNGDCIGIDLRADHYGEVVYLSHDDGEGHGYLLGIDILECLRRWTPLGCHGPEIGSGCSSTSNTTAMIDPDGEAACAWRWTLGLVVS
jgi:hypothetical protein